MSSIPSAISMIQITKADTESMNPPPGEDTSFGGFANRDHSSMHETDRLVNIPGIRGNKPSGLIAAC